VHPDGVVALQQPRHGRGKGRIDVEIGLVVLAPIAQQAQAEVQKRPQRAVGEAGIEAAVLLLGQVDRGIGDAARLDQGGRGGRFAGDAAAPAEPHRPGHEDVAQRDGEAARLGHPRLGDGNAVGDDYEARHRPSSQLRDSRIAHRISPTWE